MTTRKHGSATLQSETATSDSRGWGFGWAPENAMIEVDQELTARDVWERYSKAKELMAEEPVRYVIEFKGEPIEPFSDGLKAAEQLATGERSQVEVWIPSKDPNTPWQQMKSDWEGDGDDAPAADSRRAVDT